MAAALVEDARQLCALRSPGKHASGLALLRTGLCSRGVRLLACQRLIHRWERPRPRGVHRLLPFVAAKVLVLMARRYVRIAGKSEFAPGMPLAPGVVFADGGHLVVGARAVGAGTFIGERTTVGMNLTEDQRPSIGRNVWIGSHCVVFGDITIGDGATILPRSVLTRSVPAGAVVEGNPARIRVEAGDHRDLRLQHFGFAAAAAAPEGPAGAEPAAGAP